MPISIETMPKTRRGRAKKYDFSEQMDGNPWVIVRGDDEEVANGEADFSCEVATIRAHLYRETNDKGLALRSTEVEHEGREALAFTVIDVDSVEPDVEAESSDLD
jgi:hypothetical protein